MSAHPFVAVESLAVRVRRTLGHGGALTVSANVRCPKTDRAVDVATCGDCKEHRGIRTRGRHQPAVAQCTQHTELPPHRVSSLLSGIVICVHRDVNLNVLRSVLVKRALSGIPVVDDSGKPLGMVSKTDLLRDHDAAEHATVADVMTPSAFTVREDESIEKAAAVMAHEGIHRVPVVSADDEVVGILSTLDISRWLAQQNGYVV